MSSSTYPSIVALYFKKMEIISKLIGKEYNTAKTISRRPSPCMRAFDLGLEFKWSKGISAVLHIHMGMNWKDIKINIEKATIKLRNCVEGQAGRCPVCYDDLKDTETTYSCSTCNTMLCMGCVDKLRKDKYTFKCPICRSGNNCSHLLSL